MMFEAVAVISMTLRCHVLQSMVLIFQRRQYDALKRKLPTKLHGIKWWSSVCLRHVVQCFLMPQRNVLCLYIQDGWIWLRTMLKCFGSVFVLLELSCRKLFRIWPIGTTEWEAMEIWAQIQSPKRQRQQVLSKLWNKRIMLHGVKIQETVIWVTLAMKTWKLIHGITFQKQ